MPSRSHEGGRGVSTSQSGVGICVKDSTAGPSEEVGAATGRGGLGSAAPRRLLILLGWFLLMSSTHLWLPAFRGEVDQGLNETLAWAIPYGAIGLLAALGTRARAGSARDALVSTAPPLAMLGFAVVVGILAGVTQGEGGGEPIFLFYGLALCVTWAAAVVATARVARTKWDGFGGIGVSALVAGFAFFLGFAQID